MVENLVLAGGFDQMYGVGHPSSVLRRGRLTRRDLLLALADLKRAAMADARAASRKYARARNGGKGGWITRAEEFMAPRYRLSEAEHRQRTSAWA